jgi:TonB family protein
VLASAGFDGQAPTSPQGGRVSQGQVALAGLDGGPVRSGPARASGAAVRSGGFDPGAGAAGGAQASLQRRETAKASLDTEVEILTKPKPVYTEEARRLRIEGDVVLRVTFGASGTLVVLGVVEGLGHGLDAAAMEAARKITFTPARRNGQPVDHTATLRVVFRLA